MDKRAFSALVSGAFILSLFLAPFAHAENSEAAKSILSIKEMRFGPTLLKNPKTGNVRLRVTAEFEFESETFDEFTFNESGHDILCSMPDGLYEGKRKYFYDADRPLRIKTGKRKIKTLYFTFPNDLVEELRYGTAMTCGIGWGVPAAYREKNVWLSWGKGVMGSYILKLRKNRWVVTPWDF